MAEVGGEYLGENFKNGLIGCGRDVGCVPLMTMVKLVKMPRACG